MSKRKNQTEEEVEETTEEDVQARTIELDRTYTYEGEHFGPGEVEINAGTQERTDKIYDALKKRQKQLKAAAERRGDPTARRRDKSVTGVVNPGTDIEVDQDAPDTEDELRLEYKGKSTKVSALFGKSDRQLVKGGLDEEQIQQVRTEEERAARAEEEELEEEPAE